jgi:predicted TIM-barrel fold metal-dependent hydrolase
VRRALAFVHGLAVDVHRGTDVRVAHEFLLHFHRSPRLVKEGPEGVAERVPADTSYTATNACGDDMTPLHSPGIPRQLACHLIFGGVLDRHPKLHFSLPHGGGVLLMLMGRIDHGSAVRPEIEKLQLPQPPSKYLQRFTFDTLVHSKSVMEFVIGEVGAERIMIGSDYCFDMGYERPMHFLDQVNITSAQRKMILGDNAARILKF